MRKVLSVVLAATMAMSLAACGGSDEESTGSPAEDPAANEESSGSAADVKIGLICVHDINSGYDAAHIEGLTAACEELGIEANSQVIFRYNIAEDENCYDAAVDLAEEGCNIIFATSWGYMDTCEALAAEYLRKKRYAVVASGYRCRFGEVDLIVKNKAFLVFVEVKLRKSADFARAMEYVDRKKQDRIRTTAALYLSENPTDLQPRFDVIEIYAPDGTQTLHPEIHHLEDAFQ